MKNLQTFDQFVNESSKLGDCYQSAGSYILFDGDVRFSDDYKLVHGMVNGQGQLSGVRYGHAWVEDNDTVYDYSNGRSLEIPKASYYKMGNIRKEDNKYYTPDKARKWILKTTHWGPWEMSGDPVSISENIPSNKKEIGDANQKLARKELQQIRKL